MKKIRTKAQRFLTHSTPGTTIAPYANSLDSNSASRPGPSYLTLRQRFHQLWATSKQFEKWSRRAI